MVQPPGFNTNYNTVVRKLKKAIYGLKQAPRSWFQKLSLTLLSFGFTPTKSDSSLFINIQSDFTLFVLIYVDDILIIGTSPKDVSSLISKLRLHFALKDLGRLHYFLSIDVSWHSDGTIHLVQTKYIWDLLQKAGMLTSKPQPTPRSLALVLLKMTLQLLMTLLFIVQLLVLLNISLLQDLSLPTVSTKSVNSCIKHKNITGKQLKGSYVIWQASYITVYVYVVVHNLNFKLLLIQIGDLILMIANQLLGLLSSLTPIRFPGHQTNKRLSHAVVQNPSIVV